MKRGEDLSRILRPDLNVCVWRRALPPRFERWLDVTSRTLVHDVSHRVSSNPESALALFEGLPSSGDMIQTWAADVSALVRILCGLLRKRSLQASLATVDTNKCRKFHTDYKTLRLVCTYAGPGTEWVDNRDAERAAMGHEEPCIDTANTRIVRRGSGIRRSGPGDAVVLKGELFDGNTGRGAVHRSPPIEASGERRIVLTLDAT